VETSYEVEIVPTGDLNHLCGLTVSIQLWKDQTKYYCKCRGISSQKFVILQTPAMIVQKHDLQADDPIILRYVFHGNVWGFKTSIIKSFTNPFRLLFIDYPNQIERHGLRSCERADVVIQAQYSIMGKLLNAVIKDLSCSGCMLVLDSLTLEGRAFMDDGQVGTLSFTTDILKEKLTVNCKIIRIRSDKDKTELGLEFDTSDHETLDKIAQYVDHIISLLA